MRSGMVVVLVCSAVAVGFSLRQAVTYRSRAMINHGLLDIALSVAVGVFVVAVFMGSAGSSRHFRSIFDSIAGVDFGSELPMPQKIDSLMDQIDELQRHMSHEALFVTVAFVIFVVLTFRLMAATDCSIRERCRFSPRRASR